MENIFSLENTRRLHSYTLDNRTYFYTEWKHSNEGPKDIKSLIHSYSINNNWNKFIPEGSTVLDIGAHTGDTMLPISSLCKDGTILCIEPNSFVREILHINAELNKANSNIIIADEVVTTSDIDSILLFDHNNNNCNGGIIDNTLSHDSVSKQLFYAKNSIECRGLTLESICKKYLSEDQINNIAFIKIDTEGHDKSIIRAANHFLDKYRPVLFIEWFGWFNKEDDTDLFNAIDEINYIAFNPHTFKKAFIDNKVADLILIHKDNIHRYPYLQI